MFQLLLYQKKIDTLFQITGNDFNILIDGKSFFDLSVKNDEEAYEKLLI